MLISAKVEREGISVNTTIYLELKSDNSPQQFIYCHIFCMQTHPYIMYTELSALRIESQTFTTYLCLRLLLSKTELSSKREKNIKNSFLHFAILFLNIHIHVNIRFTKQDAKSCIYYDYNYVKNVVAGNPLTLYS